MSEPEPPADDPAVAEQLLDLVRMRRRADVEILGSPTEQEIAHTPAHQIRDVLMLVQPVENFEGVGIDLAPRHRVLGSRNDGRIHHHQQYSITSPDAGDKSN